MSLGWCVKRHVFWAASATIPTLNSTTVLFDNDSSGDYLLHVSLYLAPNSPLIASRKTLEKTVLKRQVSRQQMTYICALKLKGCQNGKKSKLHAKGQVNKKSPKTQDISYASHTHYRYP